MLFLYFGVSNINDIVSDVSKKLDGQVDAPGQLFAKVSSNKCFNLPLDSVDSNVFLVSDICLIRGTISLR